jgi:hypothetical protein
MRLFGNVVDLPCTLRVEEKGLNRDAGLPAESGRRPIGLSATRASMPFYMKKETGQCDVSVPKSIDNTDTVVLENLSSLRGSFACYKKHGGLGMRLRAFQKLPGSSSIRAPFDLDSNASTRSCESNDSVGPAI